MNGISCGLYGPYIAYFDHKNFMEQKENYKSIPYSESFKPLIMKLASLILFLFLLFVVKPMFFYQVLE